MLAGEGLGFNNNYAPVSLGPDGSAYVGVLGGLTRFADAVPPPGRRGGPGAGRLGGAAPAWRARAARPRARDRPA